MLLTQACMLSLLPSFVLVCVYFLTYVQNKQNDRVKMKEESCNTYRHIGTMCKNMGKHF